MIILYQRILVHYRLPIFKRLNESIHNELVVFYGQPVKREYFFDFTGNCIPFRTVRVKNIWFWGETAVWQNFWIPFRRFGRPKAVIMEHSPRILCLFPLFFYCKFRKIPFILWGHGGSRKRAVAESATIKDQIHRWLIRKADGYISYTHRIRKELSKVTDGKKIFVAKNTLDTKKLFAIRKAFERKGKKAIKQKLGLNQNRYICFVGRLLPDKQVDYLIEIYKYIKIKYPDTGMIIIGDGPEKGFLQDFAAGKHLGDIFFAGAISDWIRSGMYLYISDVMVMPGYVGLSVNHAFCFGLPVITQLPDQYGPYHSPEVDFIKNGKTGFLCKNGNKVEMAEAVIKVFENQAYFRKNTIDYCENHLSIDSMVDGIRKALDFVGVHFKVINS